MTIFQKRSFADLTIHYYYNGILFSNFSLVVAEFLQFGKHFMYLLFVGSGRLQEIIQAIWGFLLLILHITLKTLRKVFQNSQELTLAQN